MSFNENTRVKIPAILHLCRLGYKYLSLSNSKRHDETNIFTEIFNESITRINSDIPDIDTKRLLEDISLCLDNDDLGKVFYQMLTANSGLKIIDFKDFK
jgi:type I restriction enzyme R subunit